MFIEYRKQCIYPELNGIDTIDQLKDRSDRFVGILSTSAQATLPKREATVKQKLMTSDILQKMERRRLANSNVDEYNKLDSEIRRECQTANELMLTAQCEKIAQLDARHKSNQVHAQIRQVTCRIMMYQEGCFPEKISNSILITLPKVCGTAKCDKHRTRSLMSHVTKIVE